MYPDSQSLLMALSDCLKSDDAIFHGVYVMDSDPLVSDRLSVQMTSQDVWKAGGYRFRYWKTLIMAQNCRLISPTGCTNTLLRHTDTKHDSSAHRTLPKRLNSILVQGLVQNLETMLE